MHASDSILQSSPQKIFKASPLLDLEFLPSSFLAEVSFQKDFHRRGPGPVFTKGLSQGLGLKLRLFSQVSAQKLLRLLQRGLKYGRHKLLSTSKFEMAVNKV